MFDIDDESQKDIDDLQFCQARKWEAKNKNIEKLKGERNNLSVNVTAALKRIEQLKTDLEEREEELEDALKKKSLRHKFLEWLAEIRK